MTPEELKAEKRKRALEAMNNTSRKRPLPDNSNYFDSNPKVSTREKQKIAKNWRKRYNSRVWKGWRDSE